MTTQPDKLNGNPESTNAGPASELEEMPSFTEHISEMKEDAATDSFERKRRTNLDTLQAVLNRIGFNEIRKDDAKLKEFFATADKSDAHKYLAYINQKLREAPSRDRKFSWGNMRVGTLAAPYESTQKEVLDSEIDALSQIDNPRHRAASAYYTVNLLHLFPDGNGRTARVVFKLLDNPDYNLSQDRELFTHEDNHDILDSRDSATPFEKQENIISAEKFDNLAMLAYLIERNRRANGEDENISVLEEAMKFRLEHGYSGTLLDVYAIPEAGGKVEIDHSHPGYSLLSGGERTFVDHAFLYRNGEMVTASFLAMMEVYREKGLEKEFEKELKQNKAHFGNQSFNFTTYGESRPEDSYEWKKWTKEDFIHFALFTEHIREQVLKAGIDLFVHPEKYQIADTTLAEWATNAQAHS